MGYKRAATTDGGGDDEDDDDDGDSDSGLAWGDDGIVHGTEDIPLNDLHLQGMPGKRGVSRY